MSTETYGRKLGKLLDAVCALIQESDGGQKAAYDDVVKLKKRVNQIATEAAKRRIDQLRSDLELLETTDGRAFEETVKALRAMLPEPSLKSI